MIVTTMGGNYERHHEMYHPHKRGMTQKIQRETNAGPKTILHAKLPRRFIRFFASFLFKVCYLMQV